MPFGVHVDSVPSSICRFWVLTTGSDMLWDDWRAKGARYEMRVVDAR